MCVGFDAIRVTISKMEAFPLQRDDLDSKEVTIRWHVQQERFEISTTILRELDIGTVTEHILSVLHKIDIIVGLEEHEKRFLSYRTVLPRTFSVAVCATWDVNAHDHPLAADDLASFDDQVRHFLSVAQKMIAPIF